MLLKRVLLSHNGSSFALFRPLYQISFLFATLPLQLLSASQATLNERLALEEALCDIKQFSQVEQLRGRFSTQNPAL
jgi:hypothetical protein